MRFIPGNAQHIGKRGQQQDSMGFSDPTDTAFVAHGGFLAVLADGMGGMADGSLASRTAVSKFLSSYMAKPEPESIPDALLRALRQANEAVLDLASQRGLTEEMGTTLVAAVAGERSLYWISAGDSRAYLIRRDLLTQLTIDHVFANQLNRDVVSGRLSRAEALAQPGRDDLTSYLGKTDLTEIDRNIKQFPLEAGDRVILCSDGAYKNLSEPELLKAAIGSPQQACESLISSVLQKQAPRQDNVTVLAIDCQPATERLVDRAAGLIWRRAPFAAAALLAIMAAGAAVWQWTGRPASGGASTQANHSQGEGQGEAQPSGSKADQTDSPAGGGRDDNANRHAKHNKNGNRNEGAAPEAPRDGGNSSQPRDQLQDAQPRDKPPQDKPKQGTPQTPSADDAPPSQSPPTPTGSRNQQPDQKPPSKGGNSSDALKKLLEKGINRVTGRKTTSVMLVGLRRGEIVQMRPEVAR